MGYANIATTKLYAPPALIAAPLPLGNSRPRDPSATVEQELANGLPDVLASHLHLCTIANMNMRTVAISINKGGVGKTTVTKSLAVEAAGAGFNVVILDMDSQQNASDWGNRRKAVNRPLPLITRFCTEKDLESELQRAEKAGCDIVFIDTPPGRSSEAVAAVEFANVVLIPFENDQDSYTGVTKTALLARRLGKQAYGILNKAPPHSRSHEDTAREVLKVIELPMAPVALHRYDAHRLASPAGKVAGEFEPGSTPALQIEGLWDWLSALLQLRTGAIVHKKGTA